MLCSLTDPVGMVTHLGMAKKEKNDQNESALFKKKKIDREKEKPRQNRIRLDSFPDGLSNFPSPAKTNKGILIFITLKLKKKDKKLTHPKVSLLGEKKKIFSPVLK